MIEHVRTLQDVAALDFWKDQNVRGLQLYWACDSSDALQLKRDLEQRRTDLAAKPNETAA
jgi:hypothetical protein